MVLRQLSRIIIAPTWRNIALVTVGTLTVATLARAAINPLLPEGVPYFTYWLAVDAATVIAGWYAGIFTIVLSTLLGWYIWLPPPYSFELSPQALAVVVVYIVLAGLQMVLSALMRMALLRIQDAHEERELLVRELSHRLKNQLAVFSSIASSTLRYAVDMNEARNTLAGRLAALGAALEIAVGEEGTGIQLGSLVNSVVRPLAPTESRLQIGGGVLELPDHQASSFALVLHELATNSLKYGAWKGDQGIVQLDWEGGPDRITLVWTEISPQMSVQTGNTGFGSLLIERGIEGADVKVVASETSRAVKIKVPLYS